MGGLSVWGWVASIGIGLAVWPCIFVGYLIHEYREDRRVSDAMPPSDCQACADGNPRVNVAPRVWPPMYAHIYGDTQVGCSRQGVDADGSDAEFDRYGIERRTAE